MVSRQRIEQLVADGWIKRYARGQYRLIDVVQGYIKSLRDERSRANVKAADSRVRDARTREIEVRTAEREGRLVDVEELFYLAATLAGMVRSEHVGVSARITRDLAVRRAIDREMNGIDQRLADRIETLSERFEAGRAHPSPAANGKPGSVGDQQSDVSGDGGDTGTA
jgi:hypothetical protein